MTKRVADSYTEQVHVLTLSNINGHNSLFGGQLLSWIDEVAAVVARRHSEKNVVTAGIDRLEFRKPAKPNDTVILHGHITHTGRTSMEVKVNSYVEKLDGRRVLINEANVVMVAIDENDMPTEIPQLIVETDKEREEWDAAELRKKQRS